MIRTRAEFEIGLISRLRKTSLYTSYQAAFQSATGLPLMLVGTDDSGECVSTDARNHGPFCEAMHRCKSACHACFETNQRLLEKSYECGRHVSCHCFAGLVASAIPVKVATSIIGYLKTGEVFTRVPDEKHFASVIEAIGRRTLGRKNEGLLRTAYYQTRTIEPARYVSMVTLLESFAAQLSQHAESLAVIDEGSEPRSIGEARRYIRQKLGESIVLSELARHVGLSESHLCRLFRRVTGLTLTDYVNRCRIEWAKQELLRMDKRVSEVAFAVGYQSISQFNRNFHRLIGAAPSSWRKDRIASADGPLRG